MPNTTYINGLQFGRLTAMYRVGSYTQCRCTCGAQKLVRTDRLKSGKTKSCGCLSVELHEVAKKLPLKRVKRPRVNANERRLQAVWGAMVQRCTNPGNRDYRFYGARGVSVCPEWLGSSEQFIRDMLPEYRPGLWLERKDNQRGYCKENCRFATPYKQSTNRRNTLKFPNGTLFANWCKHYGLDYSQAYQVFNRLRAATGATPYQSEVLRVLKTESTP